jgi:hypothetical protein
MSTYERHLDRLEALKRALDATMRLPPAFIPAPKPHYFAHDHDNNANGNAYNADTDHGEDNDEDDDGYNTADYNAFYYKGPGSRASSASYAQFRRQSQKWILNAHSTPNSAGHDEDEDRPLSSWMMRRRKVGARRGEEKDEGAGVFEEVGLVRRGERMNLSIFRRALASVQTRAFDYTFGTYL